MVKETFFIDRDFNRGWDWYWDAYFPQSKGCDDQVLGEVAPTLFDHDDAVERLLAHSDACRIIVCLRDPVERSLSLFEHYVATGTVINDWESACRERPSIIEGSLYTKHLIRWAEGFGKGNILLISSRAASANPQKIIDDVSDFIGVPRMPVLPKDAEKKYGVAASPRSLLLATLAVRLARSARRAGLHGLPNIGKKIGLKRMFLAGGRRPQLSVSPEQKEQLGRLLDGDSLLVSAVDEYETCTLDIVAKRFLRMLCTNAVSAGDSCG